jgi:hypothetical protein
MAKLESIDEVRGGQIAQDINGYTAVRVATLSGVEGNADEKQFNALDDEQLPVIGDSHPKIPGITLQSKSAESFGEGIFKVTLNYGDPNRFGSAGAGSPAEVMIGTTLQEIITTTDRMGNTLEVVYFDNARGTELFEVDEGETTTVQTLNERKRRYVATASVYRPITTLTFRRRTKNKPFAESIGFVGSVNKFDFVVNNDAEAWLCTRIDSVSPDGNQTFNTTYEFLLNERGTPYTWETPILFVDPETGEVPVADPVGLENFGVNVKFVTVAGKLIIDTQGPDGEGAANELDNAKNGVLSFSPYATRNFGDLELIDVGDLG